MGRLSQPPARLSAAPATVARASDPRPKAPAAAGNPLKHLYRTARWSQLRLRIFERDGFRCRWPGCGRMTGKTSELVCDHVRPHLGDERLFWDEANLQTLCKSPCHDKHKQAAEQAARLGRGVWD